MEEQIKQQLENANWDLIQEPEIKLEAYRSWDSVVNKGSENGFRNAQATVIAPTGTISFLMGAQNSNGQGNRRDDQRKMAAAGTAGLR